MRIAYLEFWTGLGGDMLVGAFLDAGWPEQRFLEVVQALGLGPLEVSVERRTHGGMSGLGIRVRAAHHSHERHLSEIESLIRAAALPERAKEAAIAVFRALGRAEARIHSIPLEKVHFHEVGAADSIIDIVASAVALEDLSIDRLVAGVIPMTSGWVEMEHGRLPVPAPATALLLEGWPLRPVPIEGEFFTPTAAALISTLAEPRAEIPAMTVERVGYGAGTKTHPALPNLVRLWIGEGGEAEIAPGGGETEAVAVLETQIDDMEPRQLAALAEDLLEAGALDVLRSPVTMKKGRLGTLLTVHSRLELAPDLRRLLLDRSTTLGVRFREERRQVLRRWIETVETEHGPVRVKWAAAPSGPRPAPEYEDVVRLARERGVSFERIDRAARDAAHALGPRISGGSGSAG